MLEICPLHIGLLGIAGYFCELRPVTDEYKGKVR